MKRQQATDGFVPRRSSGAVGGAHAGSSRHTTPEASGLRRHTAESMSSSSEGRLPDGRLQPTSQGTVQRQVVYRSDIDESLHDIDEEPTTSGTSKRHGRGKLHVTRRTFFKRGMQLVLILLIAGAAWLGFKVISTGGAVFNGDIFGIVQQKKLQQDENGRTNVLLFGTSEDDPGHEGANLTDSIMVLSINQTTKNVYMVSIPRDLKVEYDGLICTQGDAGKINGYYSCVSDENTKEAEQQRQAALRKLVGRIVGLDIQYGVHVNYSVVRDVVGALGTITVNIEGSGGAPGVMDSNFDWKCKGGNEYASFATMKKNCPPNGHFIDYPNGPATLDAEHALYLAQARGDIEPTYGLGRSNFDRELNQQKIIKAIKEKAMSTGTLTNIVTVTKLLDAMGGNLRTNFDTSEIRTLMSLATDIPNGSVNSVSLVDADPALFGSDGANNVVPLAGTYDYSMVKAYIQKKINATPVSKEEAHVVVLNASGIAGVARTEADKLQSLGMVIDSVDNIAADDTMTKNQFYQVATDKLFTVKKLAERYGGVGLTTTPPIAVASTTDFVVIIVKPIEQQPSQAGQ